MSDTQNSTCPDESPLLCGMPKLPLEGAGSRKKVKEMGNARWGRHINLKQKSIIYGGWGRERRGHGQGRSCSPSHFRPPQEGRSRKKSIGASACRTQGLLLSIRAWPISHLSGPLLSSRLCLEPRWPTQPNSFCAQVSKSSSEKRQSLA